MTRIPSTVTHLRAPMQMGMEAWAEVEQVKEIHQVELPSIRFFSKASPTSNNYFTIAELYP